MVVHYCDAMCNIIVGVFYIEYQANLVQNMYCTLVNSPNFTFAFGSLTVACMMVSMPPGSDGS